MRRVLAADTIDLGITQGCLKDARTWSRDTVLEFEHIIKHAGPAISPDVAAEAVSDKVTVMRSCPGPSVRMLPRTL